MPFDSYSVANTILFSVWNNRDKISPLKLQKLVYFSHGWSLGIFERPLINEQVEAWPHGPVIVSLYHHFKRFGNGNITKPAVEMIPVGRELLPNYPTIPESSPDCVVARGIIDRVIEQYGKFTALQLSTMTHEPGTPWHQIVTQHNGRPPKGTDIPTSIIQAYFRDLAGVRQAAAS